MEIKPPIKIKMNLLGGDNSVIPKGTGETLIIEIIDGFALFKFNDRKTTIKFTARQVKDGVQSRYIERLQKCLCIYPDMTQEKIFEHISGRLKALGSKVDFGELQNG